MLENSRTGSGVLCGFTFLTMRSIVDLCQWIVIHHPRGHPDWRFVEPRQRLRGSNGLAVWNIVEPCRRAFPGTAGQTAVGRALSFPGVPPSRTLASARMEGKKSLLRALRSELGRRQQKKGFPGDSWMDLRKLNSQLSRGLSFALCGQSSDGGRALKPTRCWRCSSVRMGARRSTETGSARWFLFPTYTWEPLLKTWVV